MMPTKIEREIEMACAFERERSVDEIAQRLKFNHGTSHPNLTEVGDSGPRKVLATTDCRREEPGKGQPDPGTWLTPCH